MVKANREYTLFFGNKLLKRRLGQQNERCRQTAELVLKKKEKEMPRNPRLARVIGPQLYFKDFTQIKDKLKQKNFQNLINMMFPSPL